MKALELNKFGKMSIDHHHNEWGYPRCAEMDLSKSIHFLLNNAGPVIKYRLRKEILNNLSTTEEENLLEQIYQTPHFKLLQSYIKPNGYIGSGMHSWDNWRGVKLHETTVVHYPKSQCSV